MINQGKWIGTLPLTKGEYSDYKKYSTDPNKWTETIPKKKTKNDARKFSLTLIIFVIGLILVSAIKNKTRNLQKEINNLEASISHIETDLHKASLDYEVITSPENISELAKKHLKTELVYYKKSQIKTLDETAKVSNSLDILKDNKSKNKIKTKVVKKIKKTKMELQKLQELYKQPENIPGEIKISLAKKIKEKKIELKKLYQNPKKTLDIKKIQQWGAIQVVKAVLGVPIIPGK